MLKMRLQKMKESSDPLYFFDHLLGEMMAAIGDTDPELRDGLIYHLFCRGVVAETISQEQQKWLIKTILSNNLILKGIEQPQSDQLFTRSFAVLLLGLLVSAEPRTPYLTRVEFAEIQVLACRYLQEESDTRGYVSEKGWAHGLAHGADLLGSLVCHPYFMPEMVTSVFESIASTIFRETEKFAELEEDRLSKVISLLLSCQPDQAESICVWLEDMAHQLTVLPGREEWTMVYYHCYQKYYQFNQSLYFQLLANNLNESQEVLDKLQAIILEKY